MVTDSAFTVFEAALVFSVFASVFAGGTLAGVGVALGGAASDVAGALCATVTAAYNTLHTTTGSKRTLNPVMLSPFGPGL